MITNIQPNQNKCLGFTPLLNKAFYWSSFMTALGLVDLYSTHEGKQRVLGKITSFDFSLRLPSL